MRMVQNRRSIPSMPVLFAVVGFFVGQTRTAGKPPEEIDAALVAFLRSSDAEERAEPAKTVSRLAEGDAAAVAGALRRVLVWEPLPRKGSFVHPSVSEGSVTVSYELPEDYDPARAYPAMLCLADDGASCDDTIVWVKQVFTRLVRDFVLICPQPRVGCDFHLSNSGAAGDMRTLIRQLRRQVHTDPDRLFMFGSRTAGDAAWVIAINHPDLFAGVFIFSGYPRVPYAQQTLALLLRNLEPLRVLSVWPTDPQDGETFRGRLVAAHNRAISDYAKQSSLPIVGIEQDFDSGGAPPTLEETFALMRSRRRPFASNVSLWFRYPGHGQAGWLRQTAFLGEVWIDDQLSIHPAAGTDHNRFITEVIQSKMAYLEGRIEGQTVTVETRRCAEIELLLPLGAFDWTKPITVICNNRRRHHGVVRPSIPTMLETAYENWDFERPVAARITFSIRSEDAP